ncbi:MAG: hypothetical protein V4609_16605 [Pseudomonadota bacterium]
MSLRLFRATNFASVLQPGEMRVARHPGWLIVVVSAWIGLACNVALWRAVLDTDRASFLRALVLGALIAGCAGALLCVLGWRRTLRASASVLLLLAAAAATSIWVHDLPVDRDLLIDARWIFPGWPSLFGWRVPLMLVVLGLAPVLWVWSNRLRRLTGPDQLGANLAGCSTSLALAGASAAVLLSGMV